MKVTTEAIKGLIEADAPSFLDAIRELSMSTSSFVEVLGLRKLLIRAESRGLFPVGGAPIRFAVVAGSTTRPFVDLIETFLKALIGVPVELWTGEFDAYVGEIQDPSSEIYAFKPEVVLIVPSYARCRYLGMPNDPVDEGRQEATAQARELLDLAKIAHERSGADVLLANFHLPPDHDWGALRTKSVASDYTFRKLVNLEMGLRCPPRVHILDVEFLANRMGTVHAPDARAWFESKQPFSTALMLEAARETAMLVRSLKQPTKKVVVLDLDNTLWGGVVGDDGLEGIEIGTTSPRGEAFRAFQSDLLALARRGVLLAVCSKNDLDKAAEPFTSHPEMVLKRDHIAAFKANWNPKSDNIREIAAELNLMPDSFVFLDDNPAEIEIVRQFVPEVTGICLGDDPSTFSATLRNSRLFESPTLTKEDLERTSSYQAESQRRSMQESATDMDAYLASLEMMATIGPIRPVDVPRVAQLINKSNQFNLTTLRRTESEVAGLVHDPDYAHFTIRLADRFGDHGLIAIVILKIDGRTALVDTWLMSCRVLKRGVEQLTLNEIVRRATGRGCERILGVYIETKKNGMVRSLYPDFGFAPLDAPDDRTAALETLRSEGASSDATAYTLDLRQATESATFIATERTP